MTKQKHRMNEEWPSPEAFEENLTVHGVANTPLKFKLPNICDVDITGVEEVDEEFVTFPPYADLKGLLKPIHIPVTYLQKGTAQLPGETTIVETSHSTHGDNSSQQNTSLLRLPIKREREGDLSSESHNQAIKKSTVVREEESQSSPLDLDVSMSSSTEVLDPIAEDSVIDLTQDN